MNIKINNKSYVIPELTFEHFVHMEEQGISIVDAVQKKQAFAIAMGFVCIVANVEKDEANRLVQQHVLGGGDIIGLVDAFMNAVMESGFFQKALGMKEAEPQKGPKKVVKAEVATEN